MLINKISFVKSLFFAKWSKPRPLVAHLNLTNFCNLECPHCYGRYWGKKGVKDIPTEKMIFLINEVWRMGCKRISFCAGEPLMRQDIVDLIDHVKSKGILCSMNTNGHLIRKRIKDIRNLDGVTISLDGGIEHHDKMRSSGSYDVVIDAIKCAKENRIPVHTSTLICKENISDVKYIIELSKEIGFMTEWLLPFYNSPYQLMPPDEDLRKTLRLLLEYKKKGYPISLSKKAIIHALRWPDYRQRYIKGYIANENKIPFPCYAKKIHFIMEPDGKFYPCCQQVGMFVAIDFREAGVKNALENIYKNNQCRACYSFLTMHDYNLLVNHDLGVWLNYFKNFFIEKRLFGK